MVATGLMLPLLPLRLLPPGRLLLLLLLPGLLQVPILLVQLRWVSLPVLSLMLVLALLLVPALSLVPALLLVPARLLVPVPVLLMPVLMPRQGLSMQLRPGILPMVVCKDAPLQIRDLGRLRRHAPTRLRLIGPRQLT